MNQNYNLDWSKSNKMAFIFLSLARIEVLIKKVAIQPSGFELKEWKIA
jgi:hypothetical protein